MKQFLTTFMLLTSVFCNGQVTLEEKDFNNLIAISVLYSHNTNATGKRFSKSIDSLRTPKLNHIVDALIAVGKGDKSILETRFLERPSSDELVLWYVIREIHYNRVSETKQPRPDDVVANEVLSKKIDERWLLDNYYYQIHGGIASLFNDADLSQQNINIENLGFKNETEKAIFFLNIVDALVGGRFKVLQMMKNYQSILDFCNKLPKFNSKEYYSYKNFEYDDFEWIGYEKTESYNERHIGNLYTVLIAQFSASGKLGDQKLAQEIYFNSILFEPKYFKFSQLKDDLQSVYDKSKTK